MQHVRNRPKKAQELEEKFDPEMRFRPLAPPAALIVGALLIVLSLLPLLHGGLRPAARDDASRRPPGVRAGPHLPRLPAAQGAARAAGAQSAWLARAACRCYDWVLASASRVSVLYIPWIFDDLAFRVGNPLPTRRRDGLDPDRAAARGDAARDGLAAADHRDHLHGLRALRAVVSRAAAALRARPGRASSTTST